MSYHACDSPCIHSHDLLLQVGPSSSMAKHQEKLYSFMWDLLEKNLHHWTAHFDGDGSEQPFAQMEIQKLHAHLSKSEPSSMPSSQEYELIVLVVTQAVLNSCKSPHVQII